MKKLIIIAASMLFASFAYAQDLATATETFNNGVTANDAGNVEMALQNFKEALVMAEALGEEGADIVANCKSSIPILMFSIAKKAVNELEYDKAVAGLKETIEVATKYGVDNIADDATVLIPQVLMQKANGLFNDKDYAAAVDAYKAVLADFRRQIKQQEARIVELRESQEVLSAEIAKTLLGKSIYSSEDLAAAIEKAKTDQDEAVKKLDELRNREAEKKKAYGDLGKDYRTFLGWANEFENASLEVQRMIVNKLVKEITIAKGINGGYDVKVLLRSSYAQFFESELCASA